MLRGSRDFESRLSYAEFLARLFRRLNAGRAGRLAEELSVLKSLPARRLEAMTRVRVRVTLAALSVTFVSGLDQLNLLISKFPELLRKTIHLVGPRNT